MLCLKTSNAIPPPHPWEGPASSQVPLEHSPPVLFPIHAAGPIRPPLAYVDDFIKAVQGWFTCIRVVRRTTSHASGLVCRPNDEEDDGIKQPAISKIIVSRILASCGELHFHHASNRLSCPHRIHLVISQIVILNLQAPLPMMTSLHPPYLSLIC